MMKNTTQSPSTTKGVRFKIAVVLLLIAIDIASGIPLGCVVIMTALFIAPSWFISIFEAFYKSPEQIDGDDVEARMKHRRDEIEKRATVRLRKIHENRKR